MNSRLLIFICLIVFLQSFPIRAQYVRTDKFLTEKQRRLQYDLDDWISYMSGKKIVSMAVGVNYVYFAALDGGILRYQLFQNYWDYPFTTSNGLPSNRVFDIAFDETTGYLWAVTDVDTCIFLPAEREWLCKSEAPSWFYKFPGHKSPQINEAIQKNIFYPRNFLNKLPNFFVNGPWTLIDDWKIMDENFDEYPITGFLVDNWERVWFVIEDLGVGIGGSLSQRIDVFPFGLTNISPKVLAFQGNDLWIGGIAKESPGRPGIVQWRDQDGGWRYYQARWITNLPSDNVTDLAINGDTVWFATDYGLAYFDRRNKKWISYDQRQGLWSRDVLDLMIQRNTLYVGTDRGLNILDLPSGLLKRVKDKDIMLATIYGLAAEKDTIWAATNRGIYRKDAGETGWDLVPSKAAISDAPVLAVAVYNKEIWFTSMDGVFWLDREKNIWQSFPQLGLEIEGPFFDLVANEKSIWVSTPEGLLKYNRQMNYWKLFTTEDGLLSNECYRLLLDGDYIWIANKQGITQFYWNNPNRID